MHISKLYFLCFSANYTFCFQLKWQIDWPFTTFTRYSTTFQIATIITEKIPSEWIQDGAPKEKFNKLANDDLKVR